MVRLTRELIVLLMLVILLEHLSQSVDDLLNFAKANGTTDTNTYLVAADISGKLDTCLNYKVAADKYYFFLLA